MSRNGWGTYTLTARRRGIVVIDEDEELDLSMTLIVGMKTKDGLIVASDGLAGYNTRGQEHLPLVMMSNTEKVHIVAPKVVFGVSGSMVNWNQRLQANIATLLKDNPGVSLEGIANVIATKVIPDLYSDRINNPNFFIALFFAGYGPDGNGPVMYMINDGNVMGWGDDHPWLTVGTENDRSDTFIKSRYTKKLMPQNETVALLKEAIADTAAHNIDEVGGHTLVYEITQQGITRIE